MTTVNLAPELFQQFFDNNGNPLANGQVFTYAAGTSTKIASYADSSGTVQNQNPVLLDAAGRCDAWFDITTPYKVVIAAANDTDPPAFPLRTIDNVSAPLTWLTLYPVTSAERAAGAVVVNARYPEGWVDRYGTNTNPGVTDMTAAIQTAINVARQTNGPSEICFAASTYLVTSSLVLSSFSLAGVNIRGVTPMGYGSPLGTTIKANFNDVLFNCSGVDLSHFATGPAFNNVILINSSTGGSAYVVRADYSGGLRMTDCWMRGGNVAFYSLAECISPVFTRTAVDTAPGVTLLVACYQGHYRNAQWYAGRAYAAQYAFDLSGDDPTFHGVDIEFNQVVFRHTSLSGATFFNCHIESSQCLVTNATTVPINLAGTWTDNGSGGTGIATAVKFIGGVVFFTNSNTNLAVIKPGGGFNYYLEFDSVDIVVTNPIIGNSFTPGAGVALPSGTKIVVRNIQGLSVQKPPVDAFSGWYLENTQGAGSLDANFMTTKLSYTPTWSASGTAPSLGNGTLTGTYARIGQCVSFTIKLTFGSTTTAGTGTWSFSVPIASSQDGTCGSVFMFDFGVNSYSGMARISAGSVTAWSSASPAAQVGATAPFSFGNQDGIEISGTYFV